MPRFTENQAFDGRADLDADIYIACYFENCTIPQGAELRHCRVVDSALLGVTLGDTTILKAGRAVLQMDYKLGIKDFRLDDPEAEDTNVEAAVELANAVSDLFASNSRPKKGPVPW